MFDFDVSMSIWCEERGLIFTRYADDLFFSSSEPGALADVLTKIVECADTYQFATLQLNHDKTAFLSRRYRRLITGIVVTPTHDLSIGRDRKTTIKSNIYKYQQGLLSQEDRQKVCGMLAFIRDVEPSFYLILVRKYGEETIKDIEL